MVKAFLPLYLEYISQFDVSYCAFYLRWDLTFYGILFVQCYYQWPINDLCYHKSALSTYYE